MRLAALQHSLMYSLHQGRPPLALLLADDGRGWSIYRTGYLANLSEALRDVYPVCDRLVGTDCFTALARSYLPQHPSVSADLQFHILWGLLLAVTLTRGPGSYSLDHLLGRWLSDRTPRGPRAIA